MAVHRISGGSSDSKNRVEFAIPVGNKTEKFSVPKSQYLPRMVAEESDEWVKENVRATVIDLCRHLLNALDIGEFVDSLEAGQIREIWEIWEAESKVSMGESGASSDSSDATE